jgi:BirA family biotin operon repressor/biotin-[acetyl-CoA-carboxylase] ligase
LIDGRKVAGILIEARPQEAWAILGIGLNVDTSEDEVAEDLRDTATSLRIATGAPAGRDAVLEAFLERLAHWLAARRDSVIAAFRERDALHGRHITWTQDSEQLSGEARGIDDDGALVVFTESGEQVRLDAGEVHLER